MTVTLYKKTISNVLKEKTHWLHVNIHTIQPRQQIK